MLRLNAAYKLIWLECLITTVALASNSLLLLTRMLLFLLHVFSMMEFVIIGRPKILHKISSLSLDT